MIPTGITSTSTMARSCTANNTLTKLFAACRSPTTPNIAASGRPLNISSAVRSARGRLWDSCRHLGGLCPAGRHLPLLRIDPRVVRWRRTYFHYLEDSGLGPKNIVLGDARLSLERELASGRRQNFDVLVLDAFSGDSIPTHLLTREAFETFSQQIAPDGVIAVHISNRHLQLVPVVRAVAAEFGFKTVRIWVEEDDDDPLQYASDWVLLTKNANFLATVLPTESDEPLKDDYSVPLWTDHFSNLFQILGKP